jgi:uncharacterized Tic20 family protein
MNDSPVATEPDHTPDLPAAPAEYVATSDDRTTGMLCHLVGILAGIIGAIIMHLCMTNKSPFVAHHTKESLNFQITIFLIEGLVMVVGIITAIVTGGFTFLITIPLFLVLYIIFVVLEVMACIAAHKGQWHHYPLAIRFVK